MADLVLRGLRIHLEVAYPVVARSSDLEVLVEVHDGLEAVQLADPTVGSEVVLQEVPIAGLEAVLEAHSTVVEVAVATDYAGEVGLAEDRSCSEDHPANWEEDPAEVDDHPIAVADRMAADEVGHRSHRIAVGCMPCVGEVLTSSRCVEVLPSDQIGGFGANRIVYAGKRRIRKRQQIYRLEKV